jgi:hypothetical protein
MKRELSSFSDNADARVAAYESLLDLFTLISFVLIFAAVIYVSQISARYEGGSLIDSKVARHGSGTAQMLPHEGLLITIYRDGSKDQLSIKNLGSGEVTNKEVIQDDVDSCLAEFLPLLITLDKTSVAISGKKDSVNVNLLFSVQLWLTEHNLKYHLYFRPTND